MLSTLGRWLGTTRVQSFMISSHAWATNALNVQNYYMFTRFLSCCPFRPSSSAPPYPRNHSVFSISIILLLQECDLNDIIECATFHFTLSLMPWEPPKQHLVAVCFGEGNPLQCSCLENPRDGGAWWAAVCGVTQSQTWLKRLSSSSSSLFMPSGIPWCEPKTVLLIIHLFLTFWLLKLLWDFPVDNGFHFSGTHTREGNGLVPCESESHSVMPDSLQPHGLYRPWNSPGQNTGVGSLSLLQGIFPTQGLNPGLQSCRQILYQLSYQGSPALRKVHIHFF